MTAAPPTNPPSSSCASGRPGPLPVVVLVSGSGTLLQALIDAPAHHVDYEIAAVGADRECYGLERALLAGIPTFTVETQHFGARSDWDGALADAVTRALPDTAPISSSDAEDGAPYLVVSAGFMKILGARTLAEHTVINTHPALLPSFPGAHGVRDALAYGVKVTGTIYAFYPQTNLWTIGATGVVSPEGEATSQDITTGAMYLLGIVLVFALAVVMGRGARQKQEQQQIENQAAEVDARAELARDLHDVVAHRISMVAVRAETAPYANVDMDEKSKVAFAEIAHDARGALDEMREVLGVLQHGEGIQRRPMPQTSDIPSLFEDARSVGTPIVTSGEVPQMNAVNGHVAYRVIQEALTNARRHGSGNTVTVNLDENDGIVIRVSNPTRSESFVMGRGLSGMRERVIQRGGQFRADISDGFFIIEVRLPKGEHE